MKTAYPCGVADTEQRTLFASSGYSPKSRYGDELLNKVVLIFAHTPLNVSSKTVDQSEDPGGGASTASFCLQ